MYGLRKIHIDGIHHKFKWPLEIGAVVKCPDWDPRPFCGNGLHMLPEGIGDYELLDGHYWCVVEFDEEKMVGIDSGKAKVPECKIVYLSESPAGLEDFFDFSKFDSKTAYYWALTIGDRDIMRDKVTESPYAYSWAFNIGDRDVMRDRVTDSQYAYYWALTIGDVEIMRDRITDSEYAYLWAFYIGDRKLMCDRVTESQYAYFWVCVIGDVEIMRDRITDPYWKEKFNEEFGEKPCTD